MLFLYNPFGAELVANVARGVDASLRSEPRSIYVVYYNPTAAHCFDASPLPTRRFVRQIPCARAGTLLWADESDPVIIWQGGSAPTPLVAANARLVTVTNGSRVILEEV